MYKIISGDSHTVSNEVSKAISEGYVLHGSPYAQNNTHYQAVTKGGVIVNVENLVKPIEFAGELLRADGLDIEKIKAEILDALKATVNESQVVSETIAAPVKEQKADKKESK